MAMGVMTLTRVAAAQTAQVEGPAAPNSQGTPLQLRGSASAATEEPVAPSTIGWKLATMAAIAAGGAFYLKRKQASNVAPARAIRVVSRVAVGVRTELVVVEVDGQRLLLGITPASVQRLASLGDEPVAPERGADDNASSAASLGERFDAVLQRSAPPRRDRGSAKDDDAPMRSGELDVRGLEEQARGLAALRRR
jgi:flagellar protein FliO/FliZ